VITNLKLNFTLAYLGSSNSDLIAAVDAAALQNLSTLFYRWFPDPTVTMAGGVRVRFPDYSAACFNSHDASNVSKSSAACDLETDTLQTLYHRDLKEEDVDLVSGLFTPTP
jgi:ABC-type proline/glycine betaine transport system substrate-binding protein